MAGKTRGGSLRLMERLFGGGAIAGASDAALVERFAATRDAEAFAALVARHGAMVMATCRGCLGCGGDAEDAFQATFLVLMNRAGSFSVGTTLGGWLYRVARRVSRQARLAESRRRRREAVAGLCRGASEESTPERSELIGVIQQEIDRLPERYRAPIVLCDLQGLTRDEAARLLGCPPGTVGGRLDRARRQLRERLERRGVSPSVVMPPPFEIAPWVGHWRVSLDAAIRGASALASGEAARPVAKGLATRAGPGIVGAPVKIAAVAMLVAAVTIGVVSSRLTAQPPTPAPAPQAAAPAAPAKKAQPDNPDDPKRAGRFAGTVVGPEGKPVKGARVFIRPVYVSSEMAGMVRTLSDAEGRFAFDAPDMTFTELDGLPARRSGLLFATADGYQPDWMDTWGENYSSFHSHFDPVKGAELKLQLSREDAPIHGTILDPDGKPLAGARVRVTLVQIPWQRDLDKHLDKYKLSLNQVWTFDYDRTLSRPRLLPGMDGEAATDGQGRFRLAGIGKDRLAGLLITAPGVADASVEVMTRDAPDVILRREPDGYPRQATFGAGFTFKMKKELPLGGIVRDKDTHKPLSDVWVGPNVLYSLRYQTAREPALTDVNGRFTVHGMEPGYHNGTITAVPKPGTPYLQAQIKFEEKPEVIIDLARGIPFRIKLTDEAGKPVDAEVRYDNVSPNPHAEGLYRVQGEPISQAVRTGAGVYEGFAIPGPGVVLVKTPDGAGYRSAMVDPKAFFEPGRTKWTAQEQITAYGTLQNLSIGGGWDDQDNYSAIVLVNPPAASGPLELSATVVRDRPRKVTLVDPEGKPVTGVRTEGMTSHPYDSEPTLRMSTFDLKKFNPGRPRRILFYQEDRKLVGFLLVRGEGEREYIVRMQPWATVKGQILDDQGLPLSSSRPPAFPVNPAVVTMGSKLQAECLTDPSIGDLRDTHTDAVGRIHLERLVPGQRYSAEIYRNFGMYSGMAFENLVLKPGEVRDLGEIRSKKPVDVRGK